jgi:hypothetical protein
MDDFDELRELEERDRQAREEKRRRRFTMAAAGAALVLGLVGYVARGTLPDIGIVLGPRPASQPPADTGPPPPPPPVPPVYNAVFDGATTVRPLRVPPRQPVQLRFFIGPPSTDNALNADKWTVNPALLAQDGRLGLLVTMYCPFCAGPKLQTDPITYDGDARRSTEARFVLVADPDLVQEGRGVVVLNVSRNGQEYDNVRVDVLVGDEAQPPEVSLPVPAWDPPADDKSGPVDLVIVANAAPNGRLALTFIPYDPKLAGAILPLATTKTGGLRTFMSGPATTRHLAGLVTSIYANLEAQAAPFESRLRKHLSGSASGVPSLASLDNMPEKDALALLESMVDGTRPLYGELFLRGEDDLAEIVDALERLNLGHTARIVVMVGEVAVPWQLLHPPGALDPDNVWGFKFELTVVPIRDRPGRRLASERAASNTPPPVVFGVWGNRKTDEVVWALGRQSVASMKALGHAPAMVASKDELMTALSSGRSTLSLLATYTHGHGGVGIAAGPSGPVFGTDPAGARIDFDVDSYVSAVDLERLAAKILTADDFRKTFFLGARPIVFLNACSTGTSAVTASSGLGFPETLLWLGARAVVTTEGPVPAYFAYYFADGLLAHIVKGERVPAAVLHERRAMWEKHNPLGLLYGYVGSPFARGL